MALRQRLRRRLGREARRAAAALGRVARQIDPAPDPTPPVPDAGGGPPAHWLAVVRARAPHLLEGRGIGARVADRPVSRAAAPDELDFAPVPDPLASRRASLEGDAGASGGPGTRLRRWPEPAAGRPGDGTRWDELGPSHQEAAGSWAPASTQPPPPAAWAAPPNAGPVPAPGWPAAAAPRRPQSDWPGAVARPPVPLQWAEPAPGQEVGPGPWPAEPGPVPVATAWPDRWPAAPASHHVPTDAAGTTRAVVVADTTRPAVTSPPDIAFDDRTGPWPDLPPIDLAVPTTGSRLPAVPARGPFDGARVARLEAEQLGQPLDRPR